MFTRRKFDIYPHDLTTTQKSFFKNSMDWTDEQGALLVDIIKTSKVMDNSIAECEVGMDGTRLVLTSDLGYTRVQSLISARWLATFDVETGLFLVSKHLKLHNKRVTTLDTLQAD